MRPGGLPTASGRWQELFEMGEKMRVFYCIVGGSGRWIAREMSETGTVMTDWIYAGHAPRVTDQYIIIARQLTRQVIGTDPMPDPHYLGGGSSVTFAWDGHHMRQIY